MKHEEADFDFASFEAEAIEALKEGKSVLGKDGLFTPLLQRFLEKALESELDGHLEGQQGNKRNGKSRKTVRSSDGTFELETPRDREGSFEPQIVKKRQVFLGEDLESKILYLYSKGNSYSQVKALMHELYGLSISKSQISEVTDKIIPELEAWQSRPIRKMYPFVWLDAMHFKVRHNGVVESRALYNVLALNKDGGKELLGLYVAEQESSKLWLQVLEDLQNRGLEDILIACTDNLPGFGQAISAIFPETITQLCIVHQIRNSMKYVVHRDRKEFADDLKPIYKASSRESAELALDKAELKWEHKYAPAFKSWRNNWDELSSFFDFSKDIRRIIYTTNAIEAVHRQIRRITKTKGVFSSQMALKKMVYLAIRDLTKTWTGKQNNWGLVISQLEIKFDHRFNRID